jgi:hypothetical protein
MRSKMGKMIFRPRFPLTKREVDALIKSGYTPVVRWVKKNAKGPRKYLTTKEAQTDAALN